MPSSVTPCADVFVVLDDVSPLRLLIVTGDDLVLELAGLLRGFRLVLRGDGEGVLLVARDLPLLGDVLGGVAHVIAVEGVHQAVLQHGVDHLQVAHLGAAAQMRAVRRLDMDSWPPATTISASPARSAACRAPRRAGPNRRAGSMS
jgi:hypothetical protein